MKGNQLWSLATSRRRGKTARNVSRWRGKWRRGGRLCYSGFSIQLSSEFYANFRKLSESKIKIGHASIGRSGSWWEQVALDGRREPFYFVLFWIQEVKKRSCRPRHLRAEILQLRLSAVFGFLTLADPVEALWSFAAAAPAHLVTGWEWAAGEKRDPRHLGNEVPPSAPPTATTRLGGRTRWHLAGFWGRTGKFTEEEINRQALINFFFCWYFPIFLSLLLQCENQSLFPL